MKYNKKSLILLKFHEFFGAQNFFKIFWPIVHFYERFKTRASLVSKIRQKEGAEPLYISFFKQKMQFSYTKRFLISDHLTHIVTCSTMPHFICLSSYSTLSWNLQTIEWHYLPHTRKMRFVKKRKRNWLANVPGSLL